MNLDFFKQTRILDGGMGQELLARGMEANGTLWSANALLNKKYHQLLLDTHLDFIKAGAEIIVTTTFTSRRLRLRENKIEQKFEYLNKKAGEIAQKAKKQHPHVLIAGGLPPQYLTYEKDTRADIKIRGILLTMYDKRNKLSLQVEKEARDYFKDKVYLTIIPRNVRLSEAPSHGMPVLIYDKSCPGSKSYFSFTDEFINQEQKIGSAA